MRVVCAPWGIVSAEFPKQGLRDLVTAGFHDVLIDFRCGESPVESEGAKPLPGMKAFLAEAGRAGLAPPIAPTCRPTRRSRPRAWAMENSQSASSR